MKEKLEKELRIKLMTDHFKNIELKDKQKNLNINLIKFDDTYQVEISKKIKISEKTVRNHISNTMQKLEVKGRANAVVELLKLGEISF